MEELKEQIKKIEEEINNMQKAYADECCILINQPGFDMYKPKWQKKMDKIAEKYADNLVDLEDEYKDMLKELNEKLEAKRKSQYRDA